MVCTWNSLVHHHFPQISWPKIEGTPLFFGAHPKRKSSPSKHLWVQLEGGKGEEEKLKITLRTSWAALGDGFLRSKCFPMTIPYSPLVILLSHFNQQKVSNPTHHRSNRAWNISHTYHGYFARLFKRSHRVWHLDGTSQITSDFLCSCPAEGREKN